MQIQLFRQRLDTLSLELGFEYFLGGQASDALISGTEHRLGVTFPEQVRTFFSNYNGLRVEDSFLRILALEDLRFPHSDLLQFASVGDEKIFFDVSHLNAAGQWDIVDESKFPVTLTMASFWSNKVWRWLKYRPRWPHK